MEMVSHHPDRRVAALALELQEVFAGLCRQWSKLDIDVGLGIGIASGYATVGVIGVEGRFDYTPIGNAVNLAARLSDHAGDGEILINRRTWGEIEASATARPVGALELKGLAQPVEAFLLQGLN